MIFPGLTLARRLEAAEAANGVACAEAHGHLHPGCAAAVLEVGGGSAIFVGAGSPLSHATGLGMLGPVPSWELDRLEAFYCERGTAISVELCPLADPSLIELLAGRGYRLTEFNNVLIRTLAGLQIPAPELLVRLAGEADEDLWSFSVGRGFLEKDELTVEEMDVGRTVFHMAGSCCYLAFRGNQPGAAGAMAMRDGIATLFADSAVPGFRRIGLHSALIRERLRCALDSSCELATATTVPGSISQRNFERNGFQVAYTKVTLVYCERQPTGREALSLK